MGFKGDPGVLSIPELLGLCLNKEETGALMVETRGVKYYIYHASGKIAGISCTHPSKSIVDILMQRNQLSKENLLKLQQLPDFSGDAESILTESGYATEEQIQLARYHKAEELFFNLLLEEDGRYEFQEIAPKSAIAFDIAFRDLLKEALPDVSKLQQIHTVFPDFDQRLFWISPKEVTHIEEKISLDEIRVLAHYRPKISVRDFLYTLSEPRVKILEVLMSLAEKGILTASPPRNARPPDSRPFLRSMLRLVIAKLDEIKSQFGAPDEMISILREISSRLKEGIPHDIITESKESLEDLSSITSSISDLLSLSDLEELEIEPKAAKAPDEKPVQEKPKPAEPERKVQKPRSEKAKAQPKPKPAAEKKAEPEEEEEELVTLEDKIEAKVKYKRFISNVTMAYNRLNLKNMNYFEMLGVPPNATKKMIHNSFLKQIRKINPRGVRLKDYDKEYLDKAVWVRDKLKEAYKTLMDPKLRKRYLASMRESREDVERRKSQALVLFNKGMVEFKNGNFSKAKELFQKALEYDPNSPVYYNMLESIQKEERATNATKFYQAAIIAFTKKNDIRRAIKLIKKAISLSPGQASFHIKLAEFESSLPETRDDAVHDYEVALELDPGNLELRLKFANFLKSIGRKQEAANNYQDILKWNPDNVTARKELMALRKQGITPKKKTTGVQKETYEATDMEL